MLTKTRSFFSFALLILCCGQSLFGDFASVEKLISSEMGKQKIQGVTAAIVKNDQLLWKKGFGTANIAQKLPVTDNTIFLIASVSKTITGTALMTLFDKGIFKLDDPINNYLPFKIQHPKFPDKPITFKMLLAHTSGISDVGYDNFDLYTYGSDSPISLESMVKGYFLPGGKYYSKSKNFSKSQPGTQYDYSNMGYALIGYLVQAISKIPFDQYCKNTIFTPLHMNKTAWFLKDLPINQLAMPYNSKGKPYGQYTFPDYPNGQLRTTATDLARFLSMFIQFGTFEGATILKSATASLMRQIAYPKVDGDAALTFFYDTIKKTRLLGHNGGEQGVSSMMFFNPKTNVGAIIITTGDDNNLDTIVSEMIKAGEL